MAGFEAPLDSETNDSIVFGYQVALLLQEFAAANQFVRIIAHFH